MFVFEHRIVNGTDAKNRHKSPACVAQATLIGLTYPPQECSFVLKYLSEFDSLRDLKDIAHEMVQAIAARAKHVFRHRNSYDVYNRKKNGGAQPTPALCAPHCRIRFAQSGRQAGWPMRLSKNPAPCGAAAWKRELIPWHVDRESALGIQRLAPGSDSSGLHTGRAPRKDRHGLSYVALKAAPQRHQPACAAELTGADHPQS
jgi:hypothetical protein